MGAHTMAGALNSSRGLAAGIFSPLTPRTWALSWVTFHFQPGFLLTHKGWKWSHGGAKAIRDRRACEARFSPSVFSLYFIFHVMLTLMSLLQYSFDDFLTFKFLLCSGLSFFPPVFCGCVFVVIFSAVVVLVELLLGCPVGHDSLVKAVFPTP